MERFFVDTTGWMAMADAKDPLHQESLNSCDEWFEQGAVLVTSNYILDVGSSVGGINPFHSQTAPAS